MKKTIYKYIILINLSVILFIVNISCSTKNSSEGNNIELIFWHSFVNSTIPALNELFKDFEAAQPDIHIKAQYVPTGDALIQKLITAIQSKNAPDICWVHSDWLDKLISSKSIYKMDSFINSPEGFSGEELADFFPDLLQSASWKDTLYALPMEATTLALLYNRESFRKNGLDPEKLPQSWAELKETALKLTRDTNGDGNMDQFGFYIPVFPASGQLSIWMVLQWTPFLWQAGGNIINDEQTQVLFNSKAGKMALDYWKDLYDLQELKRFSLTHDIGFVSGALAMVMDGPWNLPQYRKMKQLDWGITSLPAGPAGSATYLAGEHLVIFKQSKHPKSAWKFLKWVTQPVVQAKFSIKSGYLPVRRSTLKLPSYIEYLRSDPHLDSFVKQISIARGRTPIDYYRVEINQNIAEAVEKVILGNINSEIALNEAAENSNRLIEGKTGN